MNKQYTGYVRQVGRYLRCSRETKARLLRGLEEELTEAVSREGTLSPEQLWARFGAPAAVAAELQATLPPEEAEQYARRKRRMRWCVLILCGLFVACLAGLFIHSILIEVSNINAEIIYH